LQRSKRQSMMNQQLQALIKNLRILLLNLIHQILVMNGMLGAVARRRRSPSQPKGQESKLSQNRHLVVIMTVTKGRVLNLKKVNNVVMSSYLPFPNLLDERCNFTKLLYSIIKLFKMKKQVLW